jgi:hypothetical protein
MRQAEGSEKRTPGGGVLAPAAAAAIANKHAGDDTFGPPRKQTRLPDDDPAEEKKPSTRPQQLPLEVLREHGRLDAVDQLVLMIVFNPDNRFLVVEALAGCGKTAMLMGLVKRINRKKAVLLLSFTNQAITVARLRMQRDGRQLNVQTFDSLFYHAVRHSFFKEMAMQMDTEAYTYETFRDMSEVLSEEDLADFVCQAQARYRLEEIDYVLVDEAQDTPPQALSLLRVFRDMGKTVIVTGDRHQAIFGFMQARSLFDAIPAADKVVAHLCHTRRCCPEVVAALNARFGVGMVALDESHHRPAAANDVCVQALYNATLGRLYARLLFAVDAAATVDVADGSSSDKFWDAAYDETARIYGLPSRQAAADAVAQRLAELGSRAGGKPAPSLSLVFSTVHRFKGGECDVTVLAEDIRFGAEAASSSSGEEEERVRYVAGSRARWGILDLGEWRWIGHAGASRAFFEAFVAARFKAGLRGKPPRLAAVCHGPASVMAFVACPGLRPWAEAVRGAWAGVRAALLRAPDASAATWPAAAAPVVETLLLWRLERMACLHGTPHVEVAFPELRARPSRDKRYARLRRAGAVDDALHREVGRRVARLKLMAAMGRALVVLEGWDASTSPLVRRCAHAKAMLASFVLSCNLLCLDAAGAPPADAVPRTTRALPGVLGRPGEWRSLCLKHAVPETPALSFRGEYDVLVVDASCHSHLVSVKALQAVHPGHAMQALLCTLTVGLCLPRGAGWSAYLYETRRGRLAPLDPAPLLRLAHDRPGLVKDLEAVLSAKVTPRYYANDLAVDRLKAMVPTA